MHKDLGTKDHTEEKTVEFTSPDHDLLPCYNFTSDETVDPDLKSAMSEALMSILGFSILMVGVEKATENSKDKNSTDDNQGQDQRQ